MNHSGYPYPGAYTAPGRDGNRPPPFDGVPSHTIHPQPPVPPVTHPYMAQGQNMYVLPSPAAAYPDWRNENVAVSRGDDRDNYGPYRNPPAWNPSGQSLQPNLHFRTPSLHQPRNAANRTGSTVGTRATNYASPDSLASAVDSLALDDDHAPFGNEVIVAPDGTARIMVRIDGEQPQTAVFHVCERTMRSRATRWNQARGIDFQADDARAIDAMYIVLHLIHQVPAARAHIPADLPATTLAWVCYASLTLGTTQTAVLRDHTAGWARSLRRTAGSGGMLTSRGDWLFALYAGRVIRDRVLCRIAVETMLVQGTIDSEGYWRDGIGRRLDLLPDPMYRKVAMFLQDLRSRRELALLNVAQNHPAV